MADGANGAPYDRQLLEAILSLKDQVSRLEGKLDGLVDFERLSHLMTDDRREMGGRIEKTEDRIRVHVAEIVREESVRRESDVASLRSEIAILRENVRTAMADENLGPKVRSHAVKTVKDALTEDQNTQRRARMAVIGGGSVGLLGGGYALLKSMWGG